MIFWFNVNFKELYHSHSELIFKFLKVKESFIQVLDIIYLVKLLEQSLPAQNAAQYVYRAGVLNSLCVIHRGPCWGRQGKGTVGRGWVLDERYMMTQKVLLIGWCWEAISAIDTHHPATS
jgi:hypothetical protein